MFVATFISPTTAYMQQDTTDSRQDRGKNAPVEIFTDEPIKSEEQKATERTIMYGLVGLGILSVISITAWLVRKRK